LLDGATAASPARQLLPANSRGCSLEGGKTRLERSIGVAVGEFVPHQVAEVDGVRAASPLQDEDPALRSSNGPGGDSFGHRPLGQVQPVVEAKRLARGVLRQQVAPGVLVDGAVEPPGFRRDANTIPHVGGDVGLDLPGDATVIDRAEVGAAVGTLFHEAGAEAPRPSDAHLERRRRERGEVDGVLFPASGQRQVTLARTAGAGPPARVTVAVRGVLAVAGCVVPLGHLASTVAAIEAVPQAPSGVERLAGDGAVAREQQRGAVGLPARRGLVADDLHADP